MLLLILNEKEGSCKFFFGTELNCAKRTILMNHKDRMGRCMFLFMYVFQEKGGWVVVDIVLKFNCT